ncbi:PRC-barrel domain-containing protein [Noviherbaspirillum galbum]|uniref:PRC-barrel domain containing protein n=1 Tax=Noviherbaspirillum galbum TaxID=2709383 RepID=A0A6B3SNV0_9BURK|nr:PRC-barrel domain-containing protein [Noviherbaspirillum galbum]NEX60366.1 PRC-barrel domain containing protein [Noviherbaspirillum galbum]
MQRPAGNTPKGKDRRQGPARFMKVSSRDSGMAAELLLDCEVVSSEGGRIGQVVELLVDARSYQLRYVLVRKRRGADIVIPWTALYFDAGHAKLVFYTCH